MTNSPIALGRIGQIALTVHDMDRAIAFWRDTVGLKFLFQAPNVAFFDVAGVRLMLGSAESPDVKPAGTVLYFEVDDLDGTFASRARSRRRRREKRRAAFHREARREGSVDGVPAGSRRQSVRADAANALPRLSATATQRFARQRRRGMRRRRVARDVKLQTPFGRRCVEWPRRPGAERSPVADARCCRTERSAHPASKRHGPSTAPTIAALRIAAADAATSGCGAPSFHARSASQPASPSASVKPQCVGESSSTIAIVR